MAIAAVATVIYGFGNLYQPTVVVGESMSPTLHSGKMIWIDRTFYRSHAPKDGEVVVFRHDGETYVKRVYRGPGETMRYLACGGEWLEPIRDKDYSYLRGRYENPHTALRLRQAIVPNDCVFVLGDNFQHSEDSRQLGPIPISEIVGRAHLEADTWPAQLYAFVPVRRPNAVQAKDQATPGQPGTPAKVHSPRRKLLPGPFEQASAVIP